MNFSHLSAQTWRWATGSVCPHSIIEAWPIAVDTLGNVYESASIASSGLADSLTNSYFGTDSVHGEKDVLISTDSAGHYRWVVPIKHSSYGLIRQIAIAPSQDIYMFGTFSGTLWIGTDSIQTMATKAAFCARMNSAGSVVWLKKIADNTMLGSDATGAVDGFGNAYMAGGFWGAITIGGTTLTNSSIGVNTDIFIAKLDPSGTAVWAKSFGGDSTESVVGIAATYSGDILVAGAYNSQHFSIGATSFVNPSPGLLNYMYLARFDNLGDLLWGENIATHSNNNMLGGVAFDTWDNAYLVGSYNNYISYGSFILPFAASFNMFLAQFNYLGTPMWYKTIGGSPAGYSVATDGCGNVWVSGATGDGIDNSFLINYDIFGTFKDSAQLVVGGDDQSCIVTDNLGNLYLGADYFYNTVIGHDTLRLLDSTLETSFVAKYAYPFCDPKHPPLNTIVNNNPTIGTTLYPNPAEDECTITTDGSNATLTHLELFDLTGRLISTYKLSGNSSVIDLREMKPGVYFCRIYTSDNAATTKKLVVTK